MLNLFSKDIQLSIRNNHFERCDDGAIYFPDQKLYFNGWIHSIQGEDCHNLVPTEGGNFIWDVLTKVVSPPTALYIAPYSGAVDPVNGWTAANFTSNATEATAYTESVRPTYTVVAAASESISNSASPGVITLNNTVTLNGSGILTVSTKSSGSGVLVSAARRATAVTLGTGDVVNLKHTMSFSDA